MARFFPESALARITARIASMFRERASQPRIESREPETISDELERLLIARETRGLY